jgi:hypothetical protein
MSFSDLTLEKYCFTHLQCRRDIADARFLVKLIRGQLDCPELLEKNSISCSQAEFKRQGKFYCSAGKDKCFGWFARIQNFKTG